MKWIIDNWAMLIVTLCVVVMCVRAVADFQSQPTQVQLDKIKEWLLFAVIEAEKELGSGTGALKLRYVYDAFLNTFPALVNVISFDMFSRLVDEVLVEMKHLLDTNLDIKSYVEGE